MQKSAVLNLLAVFKLQVLNNLKKFQEASDNLIKLITIACEKDVDYKLTKYLVSQGIRVSLGHS